MTTRQDRSRDSALQTVLPEGGTNALGVAFGLLGDEWTLLLLRYALLGVRRYSAFSAALPISDAVLTSRLDLLAREHVLERHEYQQNPPRAEYVLTAKGRGVWPVLLAIWSWERAWVDEHSYATPPMRHQTCGQQFVAEYTCSACHQRVTALDLHAEWGPSGGWTRSVPEARTRRRSPSRGRPHSVFYPDTMAVFGNRWSSALVGSAFMGIKRFNDFQDVLGAPPSLLAQRLASLCEHDIFEQVQLADRPDWSEYALTRKGIDFFPVIGLTLEWAEHWYRSTEGPVLEWTHNACGQPFHGVLTCDQCHEPLTGNDVIVDGAA
jgi:DNA-binding HxlR family transcriptional regulator